MEPFQLGQGGTLPRLRITSLLLRVVPPPGPPVLPTKLSGTTQGLWPQSLLYLAHTLASGSCFCPIRPHPCSGLWVKGALQLEQKSCLHILESPAGLL